MTDLQNPRRQIRGGVYTLAEFQTRYGLKSKEAERLFTRFGPGYHDLDILMATLNRKALNEPLVTLDFRAN